VPRVLIKRCIAITVNI